MMDLLRALAPYHDYGWFVALLGWTVAGLAWTRTRRDQPEWAWLPWAAWPGAAAALIELISYSREVRPLPSLPDFLYEDVFLGIAYAVTAAGWVRALPVHGLIRSAAILGVFAAAGWRVSRPYEGALIIAGVATLAALAHLVIARRSTSVRLPLLLTVAGVWLASAGPFASSGLQLRAWIGLGEWSALWSLSQATAGGVTLATFAVKWFSGKESRREWRPFLAASLLWLVVGFALAAWMSSSSRLRFEIQSLARARSAAVLVDKEALENLLRDGFNLVVAPPRIVADGQIFYSGRVERLLGDAASVPKRNLAVIEEADPEVLWSYIQTIRDDEWLVYFASSRHPGRRDGVGLAKAMPRDFGDWNEKSGRFIPFGLSGGSWRSVFAREPLISAQGDMLGWIVLNFPVGQWVESQAQPRLQAYIIVMLGLGLAALVALQRVSVRERETARAAALISEQADQLKTAFLAKVSHELRTPIQSVLGYSELLRSAISDPVAHGRLAALRQHGELMLRLVNDLLDLSAIQAGAFRLVEKPAALGELVRQTAEALRPRAEAKGLVLVVTIDPTIPTWVRIDAERIRQVLLNLLGNAIKFTDVGQVATELRVGPGTGELTLCVRDTGPGIPKYEQARLFRPFERLDTTAAKEGTGLGLALSAALCRGMGGDIVVESEPGEGATFRARFRAPACAAPVATLPDSEPLTRLVGRRVLIADDNALVRELFTACLQDAGAYCVAVDDGEGALAAAAAGAFDAVVLDIAMPGLDGVEVARRLRATHGTALRIVGVSAHAGERERAAAQAAGMDRFLVKPVGLETLLTALVPAAVARPSEDATQVLLERLRTRFRGLAASEGVALAAAITESDFTAARACAHHLMNSAAVVRDDRLFMACAAAQRAAEAGDASALAEAGRVCAAALEPWGGNDANRRD